MYCRKCGIEINDTIRFCAKCGTEIVSENKNIKITEDNDIKIQIRPKFYILYRLIWEFFKILVIGVVFFIVTLQDGVKIKEFFEFILSNLKIIIGILLPYIIIKLIFDKKQYDNTEYNFYATRVEYKDGFMNKEEKELKYKHIREVRMTKDITDRMFSIGTIVIYTNASNGGERSRGTNGIFIHCVENVEEKYNMIKKIIDEGGIEK